MPTIYKYKKPCEKCGKEISKYSKNNICRRCRTDYKSCVTCSELIPCNSSKIRCKACTQKRQAPDPKHCTKCGNTISAYTTAVWCKPCRDERTKSRLVCPICGGTKTPHNNICKPCHIKDMKENKSLLVVCPICNEEKSRSGFNVQRHTTKGNTRYSTNIAAGCLDCRTAAIIIKQKCDTCNTSRAVSEHFTLSETTCNTCLRAKEKRELRIARQIETKIVREKQELFQQARRKVNQQRREYRAALYSNGFIICSMCKQEKDFTEFNRFNKSATGFQGYCKTCNNKRIIGWKKTPQGKLKYEAWKKTERARDLRWKRRRMRRSKDRGSFTKKQFNAVLTFYSHTCLSCGATGHLDADHVLPLAKGGSNTIDNIQPLCSSCNTIKRVEHVDMRLFWILKILHL